MSFTQMGEMSAARQAGMSNCGSRHIVHQKASSMRMNCWLDGTLSLDVLEVFEGQFVMSQENVAAS